MASLENINRVVIIAGDNTQMFDIFNLYDNGVMLLVQDEGRTLKIVPSEWSE